ncbi:MAG: C-GCAxxG-C-C family protein [Methanomassiliicoccaceae archaeon]|nr:C-GCAxxG-C-C family protein [Methanomassiliicoccaceae archaeon]
MSDKVEEASRLFGNGMYCSQAILGAFCERYGMDKEAAFRISCGLNSGARCAEVCGAVSGAVLVIGLKYGGSKDTCNMRAEEFVELFRERHGEVTCRGLLGCDVFTPEGRAKAIEKDLFGTVCRGAVVSAAQILSDLGY